MRRRSPDRSTRSRLARAALLVCAIALASIAVACGERRARDPGARGHPGRARPRRDRSPHPPAAGDPRRSAPARRRSLTRPIVTEGVIPEGFPSDIPVYPGANLGSSMTRPGLGVFATFETDDAVEAILELTTAASSPRTAGAWSDTAEGDGVDGTKEDRTVQVRARRNERGPHGDRRSTSGAERGAA